MNIWDLRHLTISKTFSLSAGVNAGVSRIELAGTLAGLLAPDAWLGLSSASWDSDHPASGKHRPAGRRAPFAI